MADATTPKKPSSLANVSDEDMALFVGKNWAAYEPTWRAFKYNENAQKMFSFKTINWMATFISPVWFMYRKMYVSLIASFLISYGIGSLLEILKLPDMPYIVYGIALQVISRPLYLHINAGRVRALRESGESDEVIKAKIAKAGGVSNVGAIIMAGIMALLFVYLIYVFEQSKIASEPHILSDSDMDDLPEDAKATLKRIQDEANQEIKAQQQKGALPVPTGGEPTNADSVLKPPPEAAPSGAINGEIDSNQPNVEKK